jgi:hypothetical protein
VGRRLGQQVGQLGSAVTRFTRSVQNDENVEHLESPFGRLFLDIDSSLTSLRDLS